MTHYTTNRRRRPYRYTNSRLGGVARIPRPVADALHYRTDSTAWINYH